MRFTLKAKLLIVLLLIALLPIGFFAVYSFSTFSNKIENDASLRLEALRDVKKDFLDTYLESIRNQTLEISESNATVSAVRTFNETFSQVIEENNYSQAAISRMRTQVSSYYTSDFLSAYNAYHATPIDASRLVDSLDDETIVMQYLYIANNPHPLGSKNELYASPDQSMYSVSHSLYHDMYSGFIDKFGYYDLFIIDDSGKIVYSVFKELDFATDLAKGPYSTQGIGRVYNQLVNSQQQDDFVFDDFDLYTPSYDTPQAFVGSPIIDPITGENLGVLILQFPLDKINDIMHLRTGMGDSGETYLVGEDLLMRSDSYVDPVNHSVLGSFLKPGLGKVDTDSSRQGTQGETGVQLITNHHNQSVLSAYTPIEFGDQRWTLIAEITEEETFRELNDVMKVIIVILLIILVIVTVTALLFANALTKPIKRIVGFAGELADGNLNIDVIVDSKDEIGELANAFQVMTTNMNRVLSNIDDASDQIQKNSKEVSGSSMSLSRGATEQASAIQELTASVEQIAAQTRINAENAERARAMAKEAQEDAQKGNHQMESMLGAMSEINESSTQISKIIKVIDEIAFQTNILALNAAVEAARAGQHGKGFSVVAEEVRNLASKSAEAAKETTAMIESSIAKVEGGREIAQETSVSLHRIVEGVSKATDLVSEIAIASNEQALAVDQVNQGITQISDVVQTVSATAEETASASQAMSTQSDLLKSQVDAFKLKEPNIKGQ